MLAALKKSGCQCSCRMPRICFGAMSSAATIWGWSPVTREKQSSVRYAVANACCKALAVMTGSISAKS